MLDNGQLLISSYDEYGNPQFSLKELQGYRAPAKESSASDFVEITEYDEY